MDGQASFEVLWQSSVRIRNRTCTCLLGIGQVRLFRPWDSSRFLAALPKTTERICVLDRTKEQGSQGEPLLLEVASMLHASAHSEMVVIGGGDRDGHLWT